MGWRTADAYDKDNEAAARVFLAAMPLKRRLATRARQAILIAYPILVLALLARAFIGSP